MKKRLGVWVGIMAVALGWLAFRSERVVVGIAVSNERQANFLRLSAGQLPVSTTASLVGSSFSLDLGSVGGNTADPNGELPEGTDLSKYQAVTRWRARFEVDIATATPLHVRHAGAKT